MLAPCPGEGLDATIIALFASDGAREIPLFGVRYRSGKPATLRRASASNPVGGFPWPKM
jgi:hypothetical protein